MTSAIDKWVTASDENRKLYAEEGLILEVTEAIWAQLAEKDLTKAKLAELLGSSKANISQLLDGSRNMTLRTLADIALALDVEPCFTFVNRDASFNWVSVGEVSSPRPVIALQKTQAANADWHFFEAA